MKEEGQVDVEEEEVNMREDRTMPTNNNNTGKTLSVSDSAALINFNTVKQSLEIAQKAF